MKKIKTYINNTKTLLSIILLLIFPIFSIAKNHKTDTQQKSKELYIERAYSLLRNNNKYDSVIIYCNNGLAMSSKNTPDNIAKLYRYKGMAFSRTQQFDSAFYCYNNAIKFNRQLNDLKTESKNLISIGAAYYKMEDNKKAIEYYQQAFDVAVQINYYTSMTQALNNIGASYNYTGNYLEASKHFLKALKIAQDNELKTDEANTLGNIANCYGKIGDYTLSKKYHLLEKNIFLEKNDTLGLLNVYINLGYNYSKSNDKDSALICYLQGLEYALNKGTSIQKSVLYSNIAAIYNTKGENDKSIYYLNEAYKINKKTNREKGLINNNINMANAYIRQKKFATAKSHLDEALQLAQKNQYPNHVLDAYNAYAEYFNAVGSYSDAYHYKDLAYNLSDTIMNTEIAEKMQELQIQYETQQKEQQIADLLYNQEISELTKQKQHRNYIIVIILLISLIGLFLMLNHQYRLKRKRKETELKHKLFRSQMNPHFIFNALSSIQHYIYQNKADDAARYLSNFSVLMRDILEGSADESISLEQEINIVSNYCELQKMRKNDLFDYTIENDANGEYIVPPMLAQPFIENATLHAFKGIAYKGHIWVRYKTDSNNFIIEIEDNGIGYNPFESNSSEHKSMAIKLTRERINSLHVGKQKASLTIQTQTDKKPKGTLVYITIPLEKCLRF